MTEPFSPTPDGADVVIRAARHRRVVKASGAGSSVVLLVVGAVVLSALQSSGPTPTPDELTSTTSPRPDVTAPAAPRATPTATPSVAPRPGTTRAVGPGQPLRAPGGGGAEAPGGLGPLDPVVGTPSPGRVSPPPPQRRDSRARTSPIRRERGTIATTDLCDGGAISGSFCVRTFDPGPVRRGRAVALGGELCLTATGSPQQVRFTSTREIALRVSATGTDTLWQAGEGLTYRSPGPTVALRPGECLRWTSAWDTRDRDGFVVPPGTYFLDLALETSSGFATGGSIEVID